MTPKKVGSYDSYNRAKLTEITLKIISRNVNSYSGKWANGEARIKWNNR